MTDTYVLVDPDGAMIIFTCSLTKEGVLTNVTKKATELLTEGYTIQNCRVVLGFEPMVPLNLIYEMREKLENTDLFGLRDAIEESVDKLIKDAL